MKNLRTKFLDPINTSDKYQSEQLKKYRLINNIINMIFFAMSIILVTIGILYLTGFKFDYSFNRFSSTLIAAIFVGFGCGVLALSIINVIFIQQNRQALFICISLFIVCIFLALLGVGIWGLVSSSDDTLYEEIKQTMSQEFKLYDEKKNENYFTLKINWLQETFNCCGIHSYSDWRSFFLLDSSGQYQSVNYIDQWTINNNLPYIDNVPDSCCLSKTFNCGKMFSNSFQSIDKSMIIYTKGCLDNYIGQFKKHIIFLAGLSVGVSSLAILSFLVYGFIFVIFKMRD